MRPVFKNFEDAAVALVEIITLTLMLLKGSGKLVFRGNGALNVQT